MHLQSVLLRQIHLEDDTFRITEQLDCSVMRDSLKAVGQVNPVLLFEAPASGFRVVCGFRRLQALRQIGRHEVLARIFPAGSCEPRDAFRVALWDNLSHRRLEPLEHARILSSLEGNFGVARQQLVDSYLPLLGLPPHRNVLQSYLILHRLDPLLRSHLREERITISTAVRLSQGPAEFQARFGSLLDSVRFSASLQREFLDLLDDLAAISNVSLSDLLADAEMQRIVDDAGLSPAQRGQEMYKRLYRRRNPLISRAEENFAVRRSQLNLPGAIRISHEPFFENSQLRVQFEAASAQRFRELAAALHAAAQSQALDSLFKLI